MYLKRENKTENSSPTFTLMRMLIVKRLHILKDLRMSLVKYKWIRKVTIEIRKGNALAKWADKSKMSIKEFYNSSLRWETSLGITSRVSSFEKSILRLGRINKTTRNPVIGIIREILLWDKKFFSKLKYLVLISSQSSTESVVGRTNTILRSHKGTKIRYDV